MKNYFEYICMQMIVKTLYKMIPQANNSHSSLAYASFFPSCNLQNILTPAISIELQKSTWKVNFNDKISFAQWEVVFRSMNTSTVKQLRIATAKANHFPSYIVHISFTSIRLLQLNGMKIRRIEALLRVKMPTLQSLELQDNELISISSLRKTNFTHLSTLFIYCNYLLSLSPLPQMKLAPSFIDLTIDNITDKQQAEPIYHLMKLNVEELKLFWATSSKRILSLKQSLMLLKRYHSIKIQLNTNNNREIQQKRVSFNDPR